jgi:hypothetical protein
VALDGNDHGAAVPLPAYGAALDVEEEEGDSAGREIGRDPLQTLGWTWCCSIIAEETINRPSDVNRAA